MNDNWDNDDWEEDWPDDEDGESLTIPCPSCQAEIYEDAEQCPYCGEYVVRRSAIWEGRPMWWVVLGGLGIIATIFVLCVL